MNNSARPWVIFLCSGCLLLFSITNLNGQTPPNQEFAIKVGVEEIRIDAVVLDNKGRQVTDLIAADFELSQDGKVQKITSRTYINEFKSRLQGNGGHSLSLEILTLTANTRSLIQNSKGLQYKFRLSNTDVSRTKKEGIDLNTYLPVRGPGKYYVRAAVRDMASGKIGSGYQFLHVQDLKDRRLSLSSLFVLNPGEDASAITSGNIAVDSDSSDFARKWEASRKSPARRSFLAGEGFDYMAIVYNAIVKEEPLQSQFTVFKDGKELHKGDPEEIDPKGIDDLGRLTIFKRIDFNNQMDEGMYQFQLSVTDKQVKRKSGAAVQSIDFEIRKELSK